MEERNLVKMLVLCNQSINVTRSQNSQHYFAELDKKILSSLEKYSYENKYGKDEKLVSGISLIRYNT